MKRSSQRSVFLMAIAFFIASSRSSPAQIESQGPFPGTSFENVEQAGDFAWTDLQNLAASDDAYAVATIPAGADTPYTDLACASGFPFAVPTDKIVSGIEVRIERNSPTSNARDIMVFVNSNISLIHFNLWSSVDTVAVYGGPSETFGLPLTPEFVNDSMMLSVCFLAYGSDSQEVIEARIDTIEATVYFTAPAPTPTPLPVTRLRAQGNVRLIDSQGKKIGKILGTNGSDAFVVLKSEGSSFLVRATGQELHGAAAAQVRFESEDCTGTPYLTASTSSPFGVSAIVPPNGVVFVPEPEASTESISVSSTLDSSGSCSSGGGVCETCVAAKPIVDLRDHFIPPFSVR